MNNEEILDAMKILIDKEKTILNELDVNNLTDEEKAKIEREDTLVMNAFNKCIKHFDDKETMI